MDETDEITSLIPGLREQDSLAQRKIWNAYYAQLVRMVRRRLRDNVVRVSDEEDIALSAFDSFFRAIEEHRLPKLDDRHDLWKVLIVISSRKLNDARKKELAQKRGGGQLRGESVFARAEPHDTDAGGFAQVVGNEPTPELAARTAEDYELLMKRLPGDSLKQVAQLKLEGFANREIALQLSLVERTVERKLERIRSIWSSVKN